MDMVLDIVLISMLVIYIVISFVNFKKITRLERAVKDAKEFLVSQSEVK